MDTLERAPEPTQEPYSDEDVAGYVRMALDAFALVDFLTGRHGELFGPDNPRDLEAMPQSTRDLDAILFALSERWSPLDGFDDRARATERDLRARYDHLVDDSFVDQVARLKREVRALRRNMRAMAAGLLAGAEFGEEVDG